jgi:hypothetical protein
MKRRGGIDAGRQEERRKKVETGRERMGTSEGEKEGRK